VPLLPASAILVARILPQASRRLVLAAAAAGSDHRPAGALGQLADLAWAQRRAVDDLVAPRVRAGDRVFFSGDWGFHWYAQLAGANPAVWMGDVPHAGDIVVVSQIGSPLFARNWTRKQILQRVSYDTRLRGNGPERGRWLFSRVSLAISRSRGSSGEANVFEVWMVQ